MAERRQDRDDITSWFADGWQLGFIDSATIQVTIDPAGRRAWLVDARRIKPLTLALAALRRVVDLDVGELIDGEQIEAGHSGRRPNRTRS
jgi:hypothetical protein